ncbi:ribonuclease H-like domain-containing protein [Tanacetum coccineum]
MCDSEKDLLSVFACSPERIFIRTEAVQFDVARGDDEVELTEEQSSDSEDKDEVAKFLGSRLIYLSSRHLCDDWIYEWNKDVPWVHEKPWTDDGAWKEPALVVSYCEPFNYKNGCSEWPTCSLRDGGYCNGGNLPRAYILGNTLRYQDFQWYEALKDGKLKEEALKNKAIMEGIIKDEDNESSNEGWRRWNVYDNTNHGHKEREYEMEHEHKERCKLLDDQEWPGNPQMDLQDQGVIDSGCSRHMTGNMSYLTDYEEIDGGYVAFGGNPKGGKITGKCTIKTGNLDFENVYFVRELKFNLFSVSQICDKKNSVLFNDTECIVLSLNFKLIDESQVLLRVPRKNNMYSVDLKNIVPKGGLTCLFVKATSDESKLWHRKLVATDDYSRFTWGFFLSTKDETSGILKSFISGIENLVDHKVKVIRCDNGTKFKNREMNQFCEMKGNLRQFSVARTPQQNGVVEKRNRTLIEAARTMIADSKLLTTFWAEAVNTACYVQNKVLVVKPLNKTPYELFHGKFNGKAGEGFFVGYSLNSKVFRVFNSRTRIVEENLHIRFSESTPNIVGSGLDWLFNIDALTRTMNYEPIVAGTQSNGYAGTKASDNAGQAKKETEPVKNYILLPLWTADPPFSQDPKSSYDDGSKLSSDNGKKVYEDPRKEINAVGGKTSIELPFDPNMPTLEDYRDDEDDGAEADMNNLDITIQVSPIPTTRIHKDHPLDQVIGDLQSATQKRRMSKNLEEYGFEEPKKVFHALKDPSWIEAMQEELLQFKIEANRLFLAYASFKDFMVYQMDVKSAFLYGKINEEERISRDEEEKIDEANIAWDDIQAKVDADYQFFERLQAEEQE